MSSEPVLLYPAVRPEATIFLSSTLSRVARPGATDNLTINRQAAQLLCQCRGTLQVSQILRRILRRTPQKKEISNTCRFLCQLEKHRIINWQSAPREHPVLIRGSFNFITPQVISLELTDRCNFLCRYCYQNSSGEKSGFLKDPVRLLQTFRELNVVGFELTGGEPLLHPDIEEILYYISINFSLLGVITNGSLLREYHLKLLHNRSCAIAFQVCLDGDSAQVVEKTTGVAGSFTMELRAIELIKDYGFTLRVGMIVDHPEKIDCIENTLLLAKKMGADSFVANPALDFGRGKMLSQNFTFQDQVRLQKTLDMLAGKYSGFFGREMRYFSKQGHPLNNCGAGHKNMTINWNGIMKHCPIVSADEFCLGSWEKINTPEIQAKMRDFFDLPAPGPGICKDCEYLAYCFNCITRGIFGSREKKEQCLWYRKHKDIIHRILKTGVRSKH